MNAVPIAQNAPIKMALSSVKTKNDEIAAIWKQKPTIKNTLFFIKPLF